MLFCYSGLGICLASVLDRVVAFTSKLWLKNQGDFHIWLSAIDVRDKEGFVQRFLRRYPAASEQSVCVCSSKQFVCVCALGSIAWPNCDKERPLRHHEIAVSSLSSPSPPPPRYSPRSLKNKAGCRIFVACSRVNFYICIERVFVISKQLQNTSISTR
jgi:hypothetical protein